MSFLFTLLGIRRPPPGPQCPPTVPGDEVVPVPFFDDQDLYRKMFLSFTFQFDHVLDPEKLRDSLSCLIQKPGWKKLGGRIRLEVRYFTTDSPREMLLTKRHEEGWEALLAHTSEIHRGTTSNRLCA